MPIQPTAVILSLGLFGFEPSDGSDGDDLIVGLQPHHDHALCLPADV
jgi:hypothetical protein